MSKQYSKVKSMTVKFHGHRVTLLGELDRKTTPEGVQIYIESRRAGTFRPMAVIPDGTLEKYKHCRPEITSVEWED